MSAPKIAALAARDYKSGTRPVWCPGCGDFGVLNAFTKALAALGIAPHDAVVVSGIGCSSRLPAYLSTYGFHGVHGRALALATGLKLSRPELTVLVTGGDGDGFSIGGNHFLHACRRNVDLTYVVMDNQIYGMTKGQASPTTEADWAEGKLTPDGTGMAPFEPLQIALAAGASFIARSSSSDPNGTAKLLTEAVSHRGFSFVQVLSPCITYRPEQKDWKRMVHPLEDGPTDDPAVAAHRLGTDDGFTTGIWLQRERGLFTPGASRAPEGPEALEAGFRL